jgi:UDP-N-acetylglucosamine:LPS N-acetylglucosamine transferase
LLLTDDQDRTRLFFKTDEEYAYFNLLSDLPEVVQRLMKDPARLAKMQLQAKQRAREVADTSFWGGVEEGLRLRGLPAFKS